MTQGRDAHRRTTDVECPACGQDTRKVNLTESGVCVFCEDD